MQLIRSWIDIAQHFEHTTADSLKPTGVLGEAYPLILPDSYTAFLQHFGAGYLGGFFHIHPPQHMNTHKERLLEYMDDELEALLVENNSGEILIFADSDNGDSLGWRLSDFGGEQEPKVLKIPARSFEAEIIALNVQDLLIKMIETPEQFWVKFKLTHRREYSV